MLAEAFPSKNIIIGEMGQKGKCCWGGGKSVGELTVGEITILGQFLFPLKLYLLRNSIPHFLYCC